MHRRGQSTVEYMLFLSVILLAIVVAANSILPSFGSGLNGMQDNIDTVVGDGVVDGAGG